MVVVFLFCGSYFFHSEIHFSQNVLEMIHRDASSSCTTFALLCFACIQCDQIGRFITLWATFQSQWQQLFCPNCQHILGIFVNLSKSFILLAKSFLGDFYGHLATFYWSHCWCLMKNVSLLWAHGYPFKKGCKPKGHFHFSRCYYNQIIFIALTPCKCTYLGAR